MGPHRDLDAVPGVELVAGETVNVRLAATGALAFAGVVLPMAVGAVLISLSTVVVALNAQLLRRVDLRPA